MTVRELLDRIDSRELTEWKAYFRVDNEMMEKAKTRNEPGVEDKMKFSLRGYKR